MNVCNIHTAYLYLKMKDVVNRWAAAGHQAVNDCLHSFIAIAPQHAKIAPFLGGVARRRQPRCIRAVERFGEDERSHEFHAKHFLSSFDMCGGPVEYARRIYSLFTTLS